MERVLDFQDQVTVGAANARDDIAFLRAVVEDKGPLAPVFGAHMFWGGAIFGLNFAYIWAVAAGRAPWFTGDLSWIWVPGAILYTPIALYLGWRSRGMTLGPSARGFAAAWSIVGVVSAVIVSLLLIATARTGDPFYEVWPALAFVIYGACWMIGALIRRQAWHGLVSAASFAAALLSAWRIDAADMWLVSAAGTLLCIALPGLVILRLARSQTPSESEHG